MPAVTWLDVVKSELAKAPGKSVKDVVPEARKEWNLIKSGKHPTKTQGKMVIKRKKSSKKYPKKGMRSKTRRGRLDYETHKGDKFFHRKKHLVKRKRKPYTKKHKGGNKGLRGIVSDVGDKLSSLGGNDTSTTESMDPTATNDADNTSHQNDTSSATNDSSGSSSQTSTSTSSTDATQDSSQTGGRRRRKTSKKSRRKRKRSRRH